MKYTPHFLNCFFMLILTTCAIAAPACTRTTNNTTTPTSETLYTPNECTISAKQGSYEVLASKGVYIKTKGEGVTSGTGQPRPLFGGTTDPSAPFIFSVFRLGNQEKVEFEVWTKAQGKEVGQADFECTLNKPLVKGGKPQCGVWTISKTTLSAPDTEGRLICQAKAPSS